MKLMICIEIFPNKKITLSVNILLFVGFHQNFMLYCIANYGYMIAFDNILNRSQVQLQRYITSQKYSCSQTLLDWHAVYFSH